MMAQSFGPRPKFYTWLVFDGTAYIDTDIVPPEDATFNVSGGAELNRAAQRLFQQTSTTGYYRTVFEGTSTTATTRSISASYNSSSSVITRTMGFGSPFYSLFLTPNGLGWGTSFESFTKGEGTVDGALCIGAYFNRSSNPYSGAFGTFNIYGSDAQNVTTASDLSNYTAVKKLRPCIYEGEDGFWNVQDGCFYGNSASSGSVSVAERIGFDVSSYDTTSYSYASVSNISNAYAGYTSTTTARINLKTGSGAETYVYFKFDLSSLPADATIVRVCCMVKTSLSAVTNSIIATKNVRMYSGTTAKGTATSITATGAQTYNLDVGTWTKEELADARVRIYAKRGSSGTSSNYYFNFYGATLYVFYK